MVSEEAEPSHALMLSYDSRNVPARAELGERLIWKYRGSPTAREGVPAPLRFLGGPLRLCGEFGLRASHHKHTKHTKRMNLHYMDLSFSFLTLWLIVS